jgi:hypothetical protein
VLFLAETRWAVIVHPRKRKQARTQRRGEDEQEAEAARGKGCLGAHVGGDGARHRLL